MRYRVEMSNTLCGIEERVNYMIQYGWVPQGGLCCYLDREKSTYTQAMINPMLPPIDHPEEEDDG
jgi:hypothetical protein